MVQEEKELLLKDLCARLPYGVKMTDGVDIYRLTSPFLYKYIEMELKPYLRPMSSMTEEEKNELKKEHIKDEQLFIDCIKNHPERRGLVIPHFAADWCDKNMFAYRTLYGKDMFELGLALEAPEGMYDILSWNK